MPLDRDELDHQRDTPMTEWHPTKVFSISGLIVRHAQDFHKTRQKPLR
jgi:hypothetical protein